jgi:carboxypeptidase C (cathepsin A)
VDKFLDTFLGDLFPDLADRDIHFAGESFGGKYVPVYAAMTRRKFASVILVDPFVDPGNAALGTYDHFCPQDRESRRREEEGESSPPRYLNETACAAMAAAYSQCETLSKTCSATYDADFCFLASDGCNEVTKYFTDEIRPGGRDPYDDRQVCDKPPLCDDMGRFDVDPSRKVQLYLHVHTNLCQTTGMDRTNVFFNLKHVKQALGLPQDFKYDSISWRFNEIWNELPEVVVPSTRELTALLDDKHTRILVINGNNDGVM